MKIAPVTYSAFLVSMAENHTGMNPLHRNFMSKEELKMAEKFVSEGILVKGTAVEDGRMRIYYFEETDKGKEALVKALLEINK